MAKNKLMPIKSFFDQDQIRSKFEKMLGKKKATGFIVSAINTINDSEKLAQADRNSILFACATAAALDLPINPNLGFAYIVPYWDNKNRIHNFITWWFWCND